MKNKYKYRYICVICNTTEDSIDFQKYLFSKKIIWVVGDQKIREENDNSLPIGYHIDLKENYFFRLPTNRNWTYEESIKFIDRFNKKFNVGELDLKNYYFNDIDYKSIITIGTKIPNYKPRKRK